MKEKNIQVLGPTAMAIFGLFTGYHVQENVEKKNIKNNIHLRIYYTLPKCILKIYSKEINAWKMVKSKRYI